MKKLLWLVAALAVLGAVYALAYRAAQPRGTPSGQIRETILDAADALQDGHPGATMRAVSSDYKDSTGMNRDRLYFLARQASRNRQYWEAIVEDVTSDVRGDEADVRVQVSIRRTEGGGTLRHTINLRMRREDARAWLVVPTKRWRVVSAENLPLDDAGIGF